jgi:hypothetical protein
MERLTGDNDHRTVDFLIQYAETDEGGGSGDVSAPAAPAADSAAVQSPDVPSAPAGQDIPNDVNGLLETVRNLRAEIERKESYTQFLKEYIDSGAITPQQGQQMVENFDLDDDVIPYAGDVKKMIEARVNAIVADKLTAIEEKQLLTQMKAIGDARKASDATFESRMNMAIELLNDPAYAAAYNKVPNDANAKIKFLERIAQFHPNGQTLAPQSTVTDEAIKRIQANAALPQTLASVGSVGSTQKSVKDMTDREFDEYRERQRREM